MRPALPAELARHPALWRQRDAVHIPVISTGTQRLDERLPGGGWPLGALTELLADQPGLGEFSLLLPALASSTARAQWSILIDPPWTPYPPAMRGQGVDMTYVLQVRTRSPQESLWACEQALRGLHGGAVLAWLQDHEAGFARLRRLQLAARTGHKLAFLFRPSSAAGNASPAPLRLHLQADEHDLSVRILKCRGSSPGEPVRLRRPHQPPKAATVLPAVTAPQLLAVSASDSPQTHSADVLH